MSCKSVKLTDYKPWPNDNCPERTTTHTPLPCPERQPMEILVAAKDGDIHELERLLLEKKEMVRKPFVYPRDWKYTFDHLTVTDEDGRTALHRAACVGNHTSALLCVQLILQSIQVLYGSDGHGKAEEKTRLLLELKDNNKETALHLAIENRAPALVAFLLDYNANTQARNKNGIEALDLIYQQVPDAMKDVFDRSIQLNQDHKSFSLNWGPIVGLRRNTKRDKVESGECPIQTDLLMVGVRGSTAVTKVAPKHLSLFTKETQCLSYILKADKWGAALLLHPLVKYYLDLKWKRVHFFFWIPFAIQMVWLLLYAVLYVDLHLNIAALDDVNCTQTVQVSTSSHTNTTASQCFKSVQDLDVKELWHVMLVFTMLESGKEVYQAWVLRQAYATSENLLQLVFIALFAAQYAMLVSQFPAPTDVIASLSAVTIILSTILVIFQLGKTPKFGLQVAAFKKVIYSCTPHLPIFFVWFIGFGLAFWAMFYNAEKSWMVGMLAIVAAMGTGELNAQDHLEKLATGSFSLAQFIRVFCILLFVIVIVTLYFNLLIGYAVSDIQVLKAKAETLQLSNQLSTIYTIESFLVSTCGRFLVAFKSKLFNWISCNGSREDNDVETDHMDAIYVLPPSQFHRTMYFGQLCNCEITDDQFPMIYRTWGIQHLKFDELPLKQLKAFKEIAFNNIIKDKEESSLRFQRIMTILECADPKEIVERKQEGKRRRSHEDRDQTLNPV